MVPARGSGSKFTLAWARCTLAWHNWHNGCYHQRNRATGVTEWIQTKDLEFFEFWQLFYMKSHNFNARRTCTKQVRSEYFFPGTDMCLMSGSNALLGAIRITPVWSAMSACGLDEPNWRNESANRTVSAVECQRQRIPGGMQAIWNHIQMPIVSLWVKKLSAKFTGEPQLFCHILFPAAAENFLERSQKASNLDHLGNLPPHRNDICAKSMKIKMHQNAWVSRLSSTLVRGFWAM